MFSPSGPQVGHLHEHREARREVDVPLGDVLPEPFADERQADEEKKAQTQYAHRLVAVRET
jgi:hypothetical protein